jgi:hypothetical protein
MLCLSRNLLIPSCGHATPISMASLCNPTIADSSPYESTFKLDFQCLKPPAPSDAIAFGCAARFNLPAANQAAVMDGHRVRGAPAMGRFLSPGYKVNLSEDREISDSDDDDLPSVREILAGLKQKEVIDLTADDDDPVVAALDVGTDSLGSSSANLEPPSKEPLNEPAVHDASLATPPRRSPFKNRPPWAIRKPADEIIAPFDRHEAPMRHARDTSNTAIAHSPLPEIADSIDGRAVDDVTDKRPRPLTFDVFAEDENGLVNNGQPPAKRPRRASSASSSVRPNDLSRKEEILDGHEWQAQRIVGERQTPSGLEYEVRVEKTV